MSELRISAQNRLAFLSMRRWRLRSQKPAVRLRLIRTRKLAFRAVFQSTVNTIATTAIQPIRSSISGTSDGAARVRLTDTLAYTLSFTASDAFFAEQNRITCLSRVRRVDF